MIDEESANYAINIGLHVFILFTFLTIFFFAFVSKLASKSIQNALDNIIDQQVEKILTKIDSFTKNFKINIVWSEVDKLAKKLESKSHSDLVYINANNLRLKFVGICMIIGLFLVLLLMYVYFRFVKKYHISLMHIIKENIIIFTFVGIIEFFFFTKIASKYIPVTPEYITDSILEQIKKRMSQSMISQNMISQIISQNM